LVDHSSVEGSWSTAKCAERFPDAKVDVDEHFAACAGGSQP
jgi:hypothetical protein